MYGVKPPGGGSVLGTGALATTGFATGVYLLAGLAALIAGLLMLRMAMLGRAPGVHRAGR